MITKKITNRHMLISKTLETIDRIKSEALLSDWAHTHFELSDCMKIRESMYNSDSLFV